MESGTDATDPGSAHGTETDESGCVTTMTMSIMLVRLSIDSTEDERVLMSVGSAEEPCTDRMRDLCRITECTMFEGCD